MQVYSHSFLGMNTRFVIVIPGLNQEDGRNISQKIEEIVAAWENRLSRFLPDNELNAINKSAARIGIGVSDEMRDVLNYCDTYFKRTGGLFDPTYSSVYDALKKEANLPQSEIERLHNSCGWNHVEWNKSSATIRFNSPNIKIDFGGIGKGIALKEVALFLKTNGLASAFLSFGESSIAGIGKHPFGEAWSVSIGQTNGNANAVKSLLLCDEFISVSGLQKTENKEIPHIYNPIKKCLVNRAESVMVKSACPVEAEVLSTSVYISSAPERDNLIKSFPNNKIEIY